MRLLALVKGRDHVCCRYRLAAYRDFLQQAGHTLELFPWPHSLFSRLFLHRQFGAADVLVLQRKMPAPHLCALLRRHARILIYDFDDALFLRDSYAPQGLYCSRRAGAFRQTVRSVDMVIAGNDFLRDEAALWTDPARVRLIPTCLDVPKYPEARHNRGPRDVRLAWIGSASTLRGLELIRLTLEQLGRDQPGLRLKIICNQFLHFQSLTVIRTAWSQETEARELAEADIGIS